MPNADQTKPTTASIEPTAEAPTSSAVTVTQATDSAPSTITSQQADDIIAELKSIKQNIFWLLLLAGFFAARSFFFHY